MRRIAFALLVCCACSGCEVTLSCFVQKDWNTDPHLYHNNDLQTKIELKASKLVGADARRAAPKP